MLRRLLPLFMLGTFVSCGGSSSTAPTPLNVPFSTTDLIVGTGTTVTTGTAVEFAYIGYLYSATAANHEGNEFDDSNVSGPQVIVVGAGQVIKGIDMGLIGMKVGGRRQIVIPPDLGYGA